MSRMLADQPKQNQAEPVMLRCHDRCGREVLDVDAAMQAGWSYLSITARWRCGPCGAALRAASSMVGQGEGTVDALPPESRGALRKATADTIVIPYLKG